MELERANYSRIVEEPQEQPEESIEDLKSQVKQLDAQLGEVSEKVRAENARRKQEIAALKFKISSGEDSESIVRKKSKSGLTAVRGVKREIDAHDDESTHIKRLQGELEKERN